MQSWKVVAIKRLMNYYINMKQKAKVWKALMVEDTTHKKVIVKAKQKGQTVDDFINNLLEKWKQSV